MELTREYFDSMFERVLGRIDHIEAVMATKDDLKALSAELKGYTDQAFETQQVWMEEFFEDSIIKYDVRSRVEKLEREFLEFKIHH